VAAWNVRTLQDQPLNTDCDRPPRRTALVSRELSRFDVDIAALSETRFPGEGKLTEDQFGYTFFWKGKAEDEPRIHGVGFAIKNHLVQKHSLCPIAISERITTLRIPLERGSFLTIIAVYAPTLTSDENVKEEFYQSLSQQLSRVHDTDRLILLGDFNARVGDNHELWPGVLGRESHGNCNANGELLLELCAEHRLNITNSNFRLRRRFKTTWMHPRSKHWHTLDYIITRQQHRPEVMITRAMLGADDCWTDHRMLLSKLKFKISSKPIHHIVKPPRKLDTDQLQNADACAAYRDSVRNGLSRTPQANDVNEEWNNIKTVVETAASGTLGYKKRKHEDWFYDNITEIEAAVEAKRSARLDYEAHKNSGAKKKSARDAKAACQTLIREKQNCWWIRKAEEIQSYADTMDLKNFHSATKKLYGPIPSCTGALLSSDNETVLTNPTDILNRWKEHFSELLNRDSNAEEECLQRLPQLPEQLWMALPPRFHEMKSALNEMQTNKAPGPDNLPLEVLKHAGDSLHTRLHLLILKIWEQRELPKDWKDANIVTIFKKGDKQQCGNYRGISLLSIASKILARIVLKRIQIHTENILPESQCGFRSNRGTIDMIFCARQLQEKSREQQKALYMIFYDLAKAFDSVPRRAMWRILKKLGFPPVIISIIQALHDGMMGKVVHNNQCSDDFPITCGLKQGCVLAPTLFSIYLAAMMNEIPNDNPGLDLRYRLGGGGVFNTSRLKSHRLTTGFKVTDLQYADDMATVTNNEEDLKRSVEHYCNAYKNFGLTVNVGKTKIMVQQAPGGEAPPPDIRINDEEVQKVPNFTYLGAVLSEEATSSKDIMHRIQVANLSFGRLSKRVFQNRNLKSTTKVMVYKAVILPALLYGCETWTIYRKDLRKLESFHQRKLRCLMNIKWQDKVRNVAVLEKGSIRSIESMIMLHRLRWSGHVVRMSEERLPKQIFYSQLAEGSRPHGAPKKRYKDQLKQTLKACDIDHKSWELLAQDRKLWRQKIRAGTASFEVSRTEELNIKRQQRLARNQDQGPPDIPCPFCPRYFRARIGLTSHLRTHNR